MWRLLLFFLCVRLLPALLLALVLLWLRSTSMAAGMASLPYVAAAAATASPATSIIQFRFRVEGEGERGRKREGSKGLLSYSEAPFQDGAA